jgi:hypothetical protein
LQSAASLPRLVVTGGTLDGTVLSLDTPLKLLGTDATCDLRVQAGHIEPVHARIGWDGTSLRVSDAGSVCLGPPGFKGSVKMIVALPTAMPETVDDPVPEGVPFEAPASAEPEPLLLDPAAFGVQSEGPSDAFTLDQPDPAFLDPGAAGASPAPDAAAPFTLDAPDAGDDWTQPAPAEPDAELALDTPAEPAAPAKPHPAAAARASAARPDYADDLPSMVTTDRVREAIELPPRDDAKPAPGRGRTGRSRVQAPTGLRRTLLLNAGIAALAVLALLAYRRLHKNPPVLASVGAPRVHAGDSLALTGRNFGATPADNTVTVGDQRATVVSVTETGLTVTVPAGLAQSTATTLPVVVESDGRRSNAMSVALVHGPRIASLEPQVAMPGAEITIRGDHLNVDPVTVTVGNEPAKVLSAEPAVLRVLLPALASAAEGKAVPVLVKAGGETSAPVTLLLGQLPLVTEVAPSSGRVGDRVVLRGRGFDPSPFGNAVTFNGVPALVLTALPAEISVAVPASADRASLIEERVQVESLGSRSSGNALFKLQNASSSVYVPQYFAAPAPEHPGHDHAFVSCELGPVLLLSGKADAASTGERALRTATALNAAVQAALNAPLALEVRDAPQPSVGITGRAETLVVATPEDVAGYAEPWDGGKGSRVTARALAAHWAAVLQDHLTLFAMRQRPTRAVEVSARGKALLDLYSDAARRSDPSAGIPTGLALAPTFVKAHRDLVLQLPASGQGAATAVLVGRWAGTMNDGSGPKSIQVQFAGEGARISGNMTNRSGAVTLSVPLKDVQYDKSQLRFVMYVGSSARRFAGHVGSREIEGTIQGGPAAGQFLLRFVE